MGQKHENIEKSISFFRFLSKSFSEKYGKFLPITVSNLHIIFFMKKIFTCIYKNLVIQSHLQYRIFVTRAVMRVEEQKLSHSVILN